MRKFIDSIQNAFQLAHIDIASLSRPVTECRGEKEQEMKTKHESYMNLVGPIILIVFVVESVSPMPLSFLSPFSFALVFTLKLMYFVSRAINDYFVERPECKFWKI